MNVHFDFFCLCLNKARYTILVADMTLAGGWGIGEVFLRHIYGCLLAVTKAGLGGGGKHTWPSNWGWWKAWKNACSLFHPQSVQYFSLFIGVSSKTIVDFFSLDRFGRKKAANNYCWLCYLQVSWPRDFSHGVEKPKKQVTVNGWGELRTTKRELPSNLDGNGLLQIIFVIFFSHCHS